MKARLNLYAMLLALGSSVSLSASITVSALFSDHTVLQREKTIPLWGLGTPGECVTVEFRGEKVAALADGKGRWAVTLAPLQATTAGSDLVIRGNNTITLHDVVVGEVWLCSGQSNMEFRVYDEKFPTFQVLNGLAEAAAANFPLIRQFTVKRSAVPEPAAEVNGAWKVCDPDSVREFTAVGYFFARDVFRHLQVPIGLIDSPWNGTPIESWMSREALHRAQAFATSDARWKKMVAGFPAAKARYEANRAKWAAGLAAAKAAGPPALALYTKEHPAPSAPNTSTASNPWQPSSLYNGMIHPLAPYALRGVLWYQGEANTAHPSEYHQRFAAMISQWRSEFAQGDIPFYWVQLASYQGGAGWPLLREAQEQTLSLPNTAQAVAIDIGMENDMHPKNKQEVGRRLALIAENRVYGIPSIDSGPKFLGATSEGKAVRVQFTNVASGLRADPAIATCEVAGSDHVFFPATAIIHGNELMVQSDAVRAPIAVRYSWKPFAEGHLYNSAGLPAAPFRSDDWSK